MAKEQKMRCWQMVSTGAGGGGGLWGWRLAGEHY